MTALTTHLLIVPILFAMAAPSRVRREAEAPPAPSPPPAAPQAGVTVLDLAGPWGVRMGGNPNFPWLRADVPGCVHTDLMRSGIIPDPFIGRNEMVVQGVGTSSWIYRKEFDAGPELLARRQVLLVCEGLDTIATLKLNDTVIGRADNMYRRWTFPVKDALREGRNVLVIAFEAPTRYLDQHDGWRFGNLPTTNDKIGRSSFIRKAPYHFGWDWGPRLVTSGIWRPICIVAVDVPTIEYVRTRQRHTPGATPGQLRVDLDVTVELRAPVETEAELTCSVAGVNERRTLRVPGGRSTHTVTCRVDDPRLWWPAGHGEQALYELVTTVTAGDAQPLTRRVRIGFRTTRLHTQRDESGVSFTMIVNGRPVFCKGANWIPCDSFPSRVARPRYRRLLEDAAACNMNMIRVWGGGIYEDDVFYELCDELGLMVWQDFMFSCSLYPADDAFLANVRGEIEHNVKRLVNHPCVALYCGNNECETALREWYRLESTRWRQYERLYHELLPQTCRSLDPDRDYWPSSPHSADSADPKKPEDGDTHVWTVWHGAKPLETYRSVRARFVSEFGFQSFPCMKTIRAYADPADLNLTAPDIEYHQKNDGGNGRILTQMLDRFKMPHGFENFVVLSQLQQALAMQIAVEHWRRLMPFCMGTLYWQLDDCWPVASWSSIDYYGRWKALQYFARRFYEPFHISTLSGAGLPPVDVYATCDVPLSSTCTLRWALRTYRGDEIATGEAEFAAPSMTAAKVFTVPVDKAVAGDGLLASAPLYTAADIYLYVTATDGTNASSAVHHFAPFKHLDLPKPRLHVTTVRGDTSVDVTVQSDVFAKWVWLEPDDADAEGRFSDNFFDVQPGESRTVTYTPVPPLLSGQPAAAAPPPGRFIARSLVDTYTP